MILDIIYTSALAWWIVSFSPLQKLTDKLFKSKKYILTQIIYKILTCGMCCGFWTGLIITQSFLMACLTSFLTEIMYRKTTFN